MVERLPVINSDNDNWDTILNGYLGVAHNPNGSIKPAEIFNLIDPHDPTYGAVGDGTTDDGPALRAALAAIDQAYPIGVGGGLRLRAGHVYNVGDNAGDGIGLNLTNLAAISIRGGGGHAWTDLGEYGCTIQAAEANMTLIYHRPGSSLNHNGPRLYNLNLSNRGNYSGVTLCEMTDVNHWRMQEVNFVGGGTNSVGLKVDQLNSGGDNAYAVLDQCGFYLNASTAVAMDIPVSYGLRVRDGNFNMSTGGIGTRIGNWAQSVQFRGTKWNHDAKHIVSEGGRILLEGCEFEGYSGSLYEVDFARASSSPSPFSGKDIKLVACQFTGNSGDELGLRVGASCTGGQLLSTFSNLATSFTDNSAGGFVTIT